MPSITPAEVRHIAKLARLTLTDAEVTRSVQELTAIIRFVDLLREVDTRTVEPTTQVYRGGGLANALRDDTVRCSAASPDALLSCSPLPTIQHQIQAPAAHG